MITTRTRILSILAVVAMLVSMLACFIIPASAAEASFYRSGWQQVIYDIKEYANYSDKTAPQALIDAVDAWLDIGKNGTEEQWLAFEAAHAEPLKAALAGDELHWINFGTEKDNMGKGNSNYPMYQYHRFYEMAGYDCLNWSISAVADWTEMNTVVQNMTAATKDVPNEYFKNVTFHLTKEINFNNAVMAPLGMADFSFFSGTLDGHGYGFSEIYIFNETTADTSDVSNMISTGLFQRLGNCTIKDFGINSGLIYSYTGGGQSNVSTFGRINPGYTATFTRVWSDATLYARSNNHVSALASTYSSKSYDGENPVVLNGFVFNGKLTKVYKSDNSQRAVAYGVYGGNASAPADGASFYNIISYPEIYNATTTATSSASGTVTLNTNYHMNTFMFGYSGNDAFEAAVNSNRVKNVYGLQRDNTTYTGMQYVYRANAVDKTYTAGTSSLANGLLTTDSIKVSAWKANQNTYNPTGNAEDAVYFTLVGDKVRPVASDANAIVKVTLTCDEAEKTLYINKGTTLTKADLAEELEISEAAITAVTLGGEAVSGDITVGGDSSIVVTLSDSKALEEALAIYSALDKKYLTDDAAAALDDFIAAANDAGVDAAKIEAALAKAEALETTLKTYSTYPAADGKAIPGYALVETYEAYNTAKVWAIGTTADWLKMVDDSKYDGKAKTFEGYTFHVVNDVDFDATPDDDTSNVGVVMAPLNLGSAGGNDNEQVGGWFMGVIEGHGHGFKNINVRQEVNTNKNVSLGLFGKLGTTAQIKEFGVDSGTIHITGKAEGKSAYVSTFGDPFPKPSTAYEKLYKVWSGATIIADVEVGSNYAVGIVGAGHDSNTIVNGAYFFGTLQAANGAYSAYHQLKGEKIYNALSDATATDAPIEAMNKVYKGSNGYVTAYMIANNFSVGEIPVRDGDTNGDTIKNSGNVASALEGAWKINNNQPAIEGASDVYYTITANGIRPTGTADNMIVKVTLTGTKSGELYVNKNSTATVAAIAAALGVSADKVLTINGADAADVAITGDTTLTIELKACDHTANTNTAVWDTDTKYHHIICSDCGEEIEGSRVKCSGERVGSEIDMVNGTATESITCTVCSHVYTANCTGTLTPNAEDCTANSKWVFTCSKHSGEYEIADSGKAAHDFSEAEWTPAEGAAGTKQSKTCAHCSAKVYQIIGGAEAAGVELKADAAGNIVLTLPIALKSAKLTFTVSAGYTITNVEGAAADAGFYTVANTAAGATVTITVDSALSAIGGVLEVAVTDAIAEDDTAVTDAIAQATIGFTAKDGDANGDDAVNLADALDVLYVVTSTKNVSTINAYNANVFLANDEDKDALILNVNDVYAIVEAWLLDVAF